MIYTLLKSKIAAWVTAILSALAMAYVFWVSSRRVQSAEIRSDGFIELEKAKSTWNDEKAATEIVENNMKHQEQKDAFVEFVNTHNRVSSLEDVKVAEELKNKWTRTED